MLADVLHVESGVHGTKLNRPCHGLLSGKFALHARSQMYARTLSSDVRVRHADHMHIQVVKLTRTCIHHVSGDGR